MSGSKAGSRFFCCIVPSRRYAPAGDESIGRGVSKVSWRVAAEPEQEMIEECGGIKLRWYSWAEIESSTSEFTSRIVGEGGFSTVYLALLPHKPFLLAAKVHRSSERLHRVFRRELEILRLVRHPNIVRLHGFSDDGEEGALLFEFVDNGTLHDHLHGKKAGPLPWERRMAVAHKLATALEYLHDTCDPQIIHGDIKPSNVLLDRNFDPKLCDFGSAVMGFSAAVMRPAARAPAQQLVGSPGYVDPQFFRTGMVTKKSDVYSFGVLLLELVTGIEAFCAETGRRVVDVVAKSTSATEISAEDLVDRSLGGRFDGSEAHAAVQLAARCVGENPALRPSMAEAARVLRRTALSSITAVGKKSYGVGEP